MLMFLPFDSHPGLPQLGSAGGQHHPAQASSGSRAPPPVGDLESQGAGSQVHRAATAEGPEVSGVWGWQTTLWIDPAQEGEKQAWGESCLPPPPTPPPYLCS